VRLAKWIGKVDRANARNLLGAGLSEPRVKVRWRRVGTFYAVVFVATHLVTTAYRLRGGSWSSLDAFVVANGIMLIPGLTAIVFARLVLRERLRSALGLVFTPNKWWLVAWLLPPILMLATLGASLLVPGTAFDATLGGLGARLGFSPADAARLRAQAGFLGLAPLPGFLAQGLLLGPTVCALGGLGEELAWRGLLHRELLSLGFWRSTAVTGVLWAVWHVPLTLQGYGYPRHPLMGTLVFLAYAVLFAPVLSFVRWRAGSVVAPAILHGTADGTVLLTLALVRNGGDLSTGWGSLSCVAVLLVVDVVIAVVLSPRRPCGTSAARARTS
jgi:membrane protease YdiL (CAAX protease family)